VSPGYKYETCLLLVFYIVSYNKHHYNMLSKMSRMEDGKNKPTPKRKQKDMNCTGDHVSFAPRKEFTKC